MNKNLAGLYKIAGISMLLALLWALMAYYTPESFLRPNNIENLMRRTALYGVLGIGVAFVIITAGIDLSIGSLVCFSGCLLAILLQVKYLPVDQVPVQSASADQVVVAADHPFQENEWVRFEGGKRARDMIARIVAISVGEDNETALLKLDRNFSRDDQAGNLTRFFPVTQTTDGGTRLQVSQDLGLQDRDQVWFFHSEKGLHKRNIESVVPSARNNGISEIGFDESAPIDGQWKAMFLKRSSIASVPVALLIVLVTGTLVGLLHGLLITKLNMQPFVVTLCSLLIFRSISRWLASDQMVGFGNEYETLQSFGGGKWMLTESFGIPYPFFVLVVVAIGAIVLLNFTVWGRYMQALGRNEEATRYSGVNTDANKMLAYVICSGMAALGGIMFALDANSIAPYSFGNFFELYAIAAAVLGGCSLRGGEGGILGVIIGTALMQTLYNMIILWKISSQLELAIVGVVILLGVMADELLKKIASKRQRNS